jgi:hypothetical protein
VCRRLSRTSTSCGKIALPVSRGRVDDASDGCVVNADILGDPIEDHAVIMSFQHGTHNLDGLPRHFGLDQRDRQVSGVEASEVAS